MYGFRQTHNNRIFRSHKANTSPILIH